MFQSWGLRVSFQVKWNMLKNIKVLLYTYFVICIFICIIVLLHQWSKGGKRYIQIYQNCTPSQIFFKEFHHKFRTLILKNTSQWLLLRAIIFREHSLMTASYKQPWTYIRLKSSNVYTCLTFFNLRSFLWIFLRTRFGKMYKHT